MLKILFYGLGFSDSDVLHYVNICVCFQLKALSLGRQQKKLATHLHDFNGLGKLLKKCD